MRFQNSEDVQIFQWRGLALEDYRIPACVIPRHEHVENFLHVVLGGTVRYEVLTADMPSLQCANRHDIRAVDELRWAGPTHRIAVAVHPSLLVNALDETADEHDIELTQHWNVIDRDIMEVLMAMTTDLDEGSPAGRLYDESLANALAVCCSVATQCGAAYPRSSKGNYPDIG